MSLLYVHEGLRLKKGACHVMCHAYVETVQVWLAHEQSSLLREEAGSSSLDLTSEGATH